MNKLLYWIPAAVFMAGCVTHDTRPNQLILDVPECDILVIPPNCSNSGASGPNAPRVNFNTNPNAMTVAPRNVCANRNAALIFKLTPVNPGGNARPKGSVSVVPKNLANTWLVGTNSPDRNEISITIPGHIDSEEYYGYTLYVNDESGVRCVDPRVHVEN